MIAPFSKLHHHCLIGITLAGTVLLYIRRLESHYWNIQCFAHLKQNVPELTKFSEIHKMAEHHIFCRDSLNAVGSQNVNQPLSEILMLRITRPPFF